MVVRGGVDEKHGVRECAACECPAARLAIDEHVKRHWAEGEGHIEAEVMAHRRERPRGARVEPGDDKDHDGSGQEIVALDKEPPGGAPCGAREDQSDREGAAPAGVARLRRRAAQIETGQYDACGRDGEDRRPPKEHGARIGMRPHAAYQEHGQNCIGNQAEASRAVYQMRELFLHPGGGEGRFFDRAGVRLRRIGHRP
ncbi:MAG: hypothetical protein BWX86_01866 [Verrucomicrobia bacterium ADurb.Bin122]|nr:MAG: hypothetical protein BWX86_01866 [Verrucomicrobia bacterium ADurb.Bin122]